MLPEALRLNKKQREHDQLVEFVNHLQATVAREGFLGDNLRPSLETLTALAEGMERYNKDYKADFFIAEETNVKSFVRLEERKNAGGELMEWIRDIWWFYPVWRLTGHRNWPEVFQGVASYLRALKRKVKKTHSLDMKCRDCNHYLWREYAHPWGGYCKFLKKTASNEWRCPVFESKEVS